MINSIFYIVCKKHVCTYSMFSKRILLFIIYSFHYVYLWVCLCTLIFFFRTTRRRFVTWTFYIPSGVSQGLILGPLLSVALFLITKLILCYSIKSLSSLVWHLSESSIYLYIFHSWTWHWPLGHRVHSKTAGSNAPSSIGAGVLDVFSMPIRRIFFQISNSRSGLSGPFCKGCTRALLVVLHSA